MNRRNFIKLISSSAILKCNKGFSENYIKNNQKIPNIIFFLADDLGWSDVGCYGNTFHETPNVDRLASEGMKFNEAYTACAVCSPTRASIQTGKYPVRTGITDWIPGTRKPNPFLKEKHTARFLSLDEVTIAEALKQNGYKTAFVGKWHLCDKNQEDHFPEFHGYDINIGGYHKGSPPGRYFPPYNNPRLSDGPKGEYLTDRLGDETVKLIKEYSKEPAKPFFIMHSFYTVHTPIIPKGEISTHYSFKILNNPHQGWENPKYASLVHSMDQNIGKILEELKNSGLEKDTVIIFFSDNGGGRGRKNTRNSLSQGKGYYQEGGIRVPLIIKWPGNVKPGIECNWPVISNDFYPTILEMAGLPLMPEQHMDGLSILPLLKGAKSLERDALYWHYPHYHGSGETPCSAIRSGKYKFIRHYENNLKELYDLNSDISEKENLIYSLPEKGSELEVKLDKWLKEMNAYIPVENKDYDPALDEL